MTEPVVSWVYAGPQPTFTAVVNLPSPTPAPGPTPAPPPPAPTPPAPVPSATMDVALAGTWAYAQGDDFTTVKPLYSNGMKPGDFWGLGRDSSDPLGNIVTHTVEGGRLKMWPTLGTVNSYGYNGLVSRHLTTHSSWTTPTNKRYFLQVRAKVAPGNGQWTGIWLRGDNFAAVSSQPEIDLMETGAGTYYGTNGVPFRFTMNAWRDTGTVNGVAQGQTNNGLYVPGTSNTLTTEFHSWAVDCNPATGIIACYFDGVKIGEFTGMNPTITQPMYLAFSTNYRTAGMDPGPYNDGAIGDVQTLLAANAPFEVEDWHCWTQDVVIPGPAPAPGPSPSPAPTPPAPAPSTAGSNPVTTALTGTRTFNVTDDASLDAVPFATLTAGDVVNIHHKATPYKRLIRVHTSGTQAAPIVLNGVTDSSGNRPVFSGDGASVATGCLSIFDFSYPDSWRDREAIGLIATAIGAGDNYDDRPKYVTFQNLEVQDVRLGKSYSDADGITRAWGEASGVRIQDGADVVVQNCVIHDCDFGYFTQANNGDALHAPLRPVLRNCRIYDCGMVGRATEHGVYLQAIDPIIEGNYLGLNRVGSDGSSFKSRSANLVFRYNWVESSARGLDIVHSEDSWLGVQAAPNYGVSHVYGNVICNDWMRLSSGATYPVHVGGDNMGEDGPTGAALVTDTSLTAGGNKRVYQHTVYAYDNTFVFRSNSNQTYRMSWFDLSLSGTATQPRTTAYEWNNAVLMEGSSEWAQLRYAGQIVHGGGSRAQVQGTLRLSHENADSAKFNISGTLTLGTLGLTNPATGDVRPAAGSALIGARVVTPSGLPSSFRPELVAVGQPVILGNGIIARATPTAVGALEPA